MNLAQLNTDLNQIGTVTTIEENGNFLYISLAVSEMSQLKIDSFNSIISTDVLGEYPNIEAVAFEGGFIKAIYKK